MSLMIGFHEEGALRPRLVPLRVHESSVHPPVQEILVEQDADTDLHSWIDTTILFGQPIGYCCSMFSIVLHKFISVCHHSC